MYDFEITERGDLVFKQAKYFNMFNIKFNIASTTCLKISFAAKSQEEVDSEEVQL